MPRPRAAAAALLAACALLVLPSVATAHSELVASSPAAGAVVVGGPAEITGEFSEAVDPGRSSMELRGPGGEQIARGGVPEGGPDTRMTITGIPPLEPGEYAVRWTTVTPDDDGVERGTFRFTVAAPTPSPPPTSTPATVGPTEGPSAPARPTPSPSPAVTPAPSATPAPDPAPAAGTADVLVPLLVLGVAMAGGVAWFIRRR